METGSLSIPVPIAADLAADVGIGIGADHLSLHDDLVVPVLRSVGAGLRDRRSRHESGKAITGKTIFRFAFMYSLVLEFTVDRFLNSAVLVVDKRAFIRASVRKNSLFIRI
jgi:hypothetical protein